jgi:hypothetical protein
MSMIGCYRRVTPTELRRLQSDPNSLNEFLYPEEEQLAAMEALRDNTTPPLSRNFDVDKAWQAIHFLLCGDSLEGAPPLGNVVMGGKELGGDLGYGPALFDLRRGASGCAGVRGHPCGKANGTV